MSETNSEEFWNRHGVSWQNFLVQEHCRIQQKFIQLVQKESFLNKKEIRLKKWESSLQRRQREFDELQN